LQTYVERIGEPAEYVRGVKQATKQSLVGPLFTTLGYDLTDLRECISEHRGDFGPDRSNQPIDRAFLQNGTPSSSSRPRRSTRSGRASTSDGPTLNSATQILSMRAAGGRV
jgi:hypothetical protein